MKNISILLATCSFIGFSSDAMGAAECFSLTNYTESRKRRYSDSNREEFLATFSKNIIAGKPDKSKQEMIRNLCAGMTDVQIMSLPINLQGSGDHVLKEMIPYLTNWTPNEMYVADMLAASHMDQSAWYLGRLIRSHALVRKELNQNHFDNTDFLTVSMFTQAYEDYKFHDYKDTINSLSAESLSDICMLIDTAGPITKDSFRNFFILNIAKLDFKEDHPFIIKARSLPAPSKLSCVIL